jgi:hypothetical protein
MSLQTRVVNILSRPKQEWPVIAAESTDVAGLYREYIGPLALIPAIASFIGLTVVGMTVPFFGTYRIGVMSGLTNAIVSFVLALVGVYVAALVLEQLAPKFESRGNTIQALKLVAYASTPVWLAGVLNLVPTLAPLAILAALYAIYLFYLGLPVLMNTPPNKVLPYMIIAALLIFVINLFIGLLAGAISGVGQRPVIG